MGFIQIQSVFTEKIVLFKKYDLIVKYRAHPVKRIDLSKKKQEGQKRKDLKINIFKNQSFAP